MSGEESFVGSPVLAIMMVGMNGEEVTREVEEAFTDVPYPGDDSIVTAPLNWEAMEVRSDFRGKHWQDLINPTSLREHKLLCLFSAEGFRFYLPAYLIGVVR